MKIEVKNSVKPVDYIKSIKILDKRVNDILLGKKGELLWIVEHNSVYTAGTSAKVEDLLDKKVNVIKTNRGGKYTYHGSGQKVVYFVLDLNKRGKDIRNLVNQIEKCIIRVLKFYKIKSHADRKNIGIWVGKKNNSMKIAAIGIKDKEITSLKKLGINNTNNINKIIVKEFLGIFL